MGRRANRLRQATRDRAKPYDPDAAKIDLAVEIMTRRGMTESDARERVSALQREGMNPAEIVLAVAQSVNGDVSDCPLCGTRNLTAVPDVPGWDWVYCQGCGVTIGLSPNYLRVIK